MPTISDAFERWFAANCETIESYADAKRAFAAGFAAGREETKDPVWKVLARLSIDRPTDFMVLAIKQHRIETGSYLSEAKAAIDAIRTLPGGERVSEPPSPV